MSCFRLRTGAASAWGTLLLSHLPQNSCPIRVFILQFPLAALALLSLFWPAFPFSPLSLSHSLSDSAFVFHLLAATFIVSNFIAASLCGRHTHTHTDRAGDGFLLNFS